MDPQNASVPGGTGPEGNETGAGLVLVLSDRLGPSALPDRESDVNRSRSPDLPRLPRPILARRAAARDDDGGRLAAGSLLASAGALAGTALYVRGQANQAERRHPPTGRFLDVEGVRVHFIDKGRGAPVLLLHGNGAMAEDFVISGLFDLLAERHRVVAIDRPGYGYTERPRDRVWTPGEQALLVHRTLATLGVERPIVVGHSWGTLVALALALAHPKDVSGLVLLSGYYFPTARRDVWLFAPPAIPVVGDVLRYTVSPLLGRLLAPKLVRKVFEPRPVPRRFTDRFPLDLALRPGQLRASAEESALMVPSAAAFETHYARLRTPLVVMTGDQDRIVTPARQALRLHRTVPGSGLRVIPGVGHMMHYHAGREIRDAVDSLAGHATAPMRRSTKDEVEASPGIEPGCKDLQSSA